MTNVELLQMAKVASAFFWNSGARPRGYQEPGWADILQKGKKTEGPTWDIQHKPVLESAVPHFIEHSRNIHKRAPNEVRGKGPTIGKSMGGYL